MKFTLSHIQQHSKQLFHRLRWNGVIVCPHCGSHYVVPGSSLHRCRSCHKPFSDTSGTIFHATKLSPKIILSAIYYLLESPRGISSYTLAKFVGISQPTAWRLLHIIRSNIHQKVEGGMEQLIIDEVYIGCNWHFVPTHKKVKAVKKLEIRKRQENPKWTAPLNNVTWKRLNYQAASEDKMLVVGLRDYKAKKLELIHLDTFDRDLLLNLLKTRNITYNRVITDEATIYKTLDNHSTCNHKKGQYKSEDGYSSNPIENHFSHIKRMWRGIYQWWQNKNCQYYMDEFAFRYNHRAMKLEMRMVCLFKILLDCYQ